MTDAEYQIALEQLHAVARMALAIDADGMLKRMSEAESVAPMLNPTLYLIAGEKMRIIRRMAEGLAAFHASIPSPDEAAGADARAFEQAVLRGYVGPGGPP
jgi:hypothetical protein